MRGQATIEYTALLAVAGALLAAGALAVAATPLGDPLVDAIRRALCRLGADTCPALEPCVVERSRRTEDASVSLGFVRLGADAVLLRERRSDGTVAVTLVDGLSAGGQVGAGAQLDLGRTSLGEQVHGAVLGRGGRARTWILPDARAADAFVRRLGGGDSVVADAVERTAREVAGGGPRLPHPALTAAALDTGVEGAATGSLGRGEGDGRVEVMGTRTLVRDHRTGRTTLLVGLRGELAGGASARVLGLEGTNEPAIQFALVRDRGGRPVEAGVTGSATVHTEREAPGPVANMLERLGVPQRAGVGVEIGGRVALTSPEARRVVDELARAGGEPDRLRRAAGALVELVARESELHARAYALTRTEEQLGVRVALGAGLGAGGRRVTDVARLLAAAVRPAGGDWRRLAC